MALNTLQSLFQTINLLIIKRSRYSISADMNIFTYITKAHQKKIFLFVLVTAFISMQWSAAHIHLTEHHDHGGSHHQHNYETHAHQSISSQVNIHDSIHQVNDHNINTVELDNECNTQSGNKYGNQPIVLISNELQFSYLAQIIDSKIRHYSNSKHRYLDFSTINLRAPPKSS